jgi:hypothetical protein
VNWFSLKLFAAAGWPDLFAARAVPISPYFPEFCRILHDLLKKFTGAPPAPSIFALPMNPDVAG